MRSLPHPRALRSYGEVSTGQGVALGGFTLLVIALGGLVYVSSEAERRGREESQRRDRQERKYTKVYDDVNRIGVRRGWYTPTRAHLRATAQILSEEGEGPEEEIYETLRKMFPYADKEVE